MPDRHVNLRNCYAVTRIIPWDPETHFSHKQHDMETSKTVSNGQSTAVIEAIDGLLLTRPDLVAIHEVPGIKIVARRSIDQRTVSLISGGGSGHEPSHAGLVGSGLLSAAVCGEVFASPHVRAILAAILHVRTPVGVLLIVKNYSGDRLAFSLAAEQARALGVAVEIVFVADDAAVEGGPVIGRRGVAGTVLVHKVAGAIAATGASLAAVASAARAVAAAVVSYGCSLSVCSIPGAPLSDRLSGSRMEVGLGIHGEPGATRLESVPSAAELVDRLLTPAAQRMLALRHKDDPASTTGSSPSAVPVALLVNNLGGLSQLEMGIVVRTAVAWLERPVPVSVASPDSAVGSSAASPSSSTSVVRLHLRRLIVGGLMTSLDMKGFSLTLLPLDTPLQSSVTAGAGAGVDASTDVSAALDAPVEVPAWPGAVAPPADHDDITTAMLVRAPLPADLPRFADPAGEARVVAGAASAPIPPPAGSAAALVLACVNAACAAVEAAAPRLNALDARTGDGDCGQTFATMASVVRPAAAAAAAAAASAPDVPVSAAAVAGRVLGACSDAIASAAGGTSGVLYALMLRAAANTLCVSPSAPSAVSSNVAAFASALEAGVAAVSAAAHARPGYRTMIDALTPAAQALRAAADAAVEESTAATVAAAAAAAAAARAGASSTADMPPVAGRAAYVDAAAAKGFEDPGAAAAAAWLTAVADALAAAAPA